MTYRHLKKEEIDLLISNNCVAEDWTSVTVKGGFSPENINNTRFEGIVKLGISSGSIELENNIFKTCGIRSSTIRNCEIGDNVLISDVKDLSNYIVEENVAIYNVGSLIVNGESTFGNGTEIEVLNEGGGRELPIFDRLSAQIGYLAVLYRHDKVFTAKILGLIKDHCESKRSIRGRINIGARIHDSLIIRNVLVGSHAVISGASLLEEGTIQSCFNAPVFIGAGVTARNFIVLSGSKIDGGVILEKSFVGQGVRMGKQFSSENSVFFANCEAFHGEACSLFAGPYSVSHHKSTLIIASLVSFFNAGSGTNQSNHMYKLGPLHQGILERGSKTGSFSYLLLPGHIGAFSVVMGKHYSNFDTSDFPFSYISEEKGKSELTPAMNLFTVGTRRDCEKWPARDKRKDIDKMDLIHFDLFSPYIIGKTINAIEILDKLAEKADKKQDYVNYKGICIRRLLLKTTRRFYDLALKVYIGQELVKRIKSLDNNSSLTGLRSLLAIKGNEGTGKWADICGMLTPVSKIDELIDSVRNSRIKSIDDLHQNLALIFENYEKYAWQWYAELIYNQAGEKPENISIDGIIQIISDWRSTAVKLNSMILKDAEKEFDPGSKIGFGIDGDVEIRDRDFQAVRGEYENNKFVKGLQQESKNIEEEADRLIGILKNITN
jgi:hypothetical protein